MWINPIIYKKKKAVRFECVNMSAKYAAAL